MGCCGLHWGAWDGHVAVLCGGVWGAVGCSTRVLWGPCCVSRCVECSAVPRCTVVLWGALGAVLYGEDGVGWIREVVLSF